MPIFTIVVTEVRKIASVLNSPELQLLRLLLLFHSFQHQLVVFHWGLSDRKSTQVSNTLLSMQADLKNAGKIIIIIIIIIIIL